MRRLNFIAWAVLATLHGGINNAARATPPEFARDVAPIFAKYCAGCHNGDERESDLSLESFAELQKGGDRGAVVVPGRADASLLIRVLTGEVDPSMPPEDNPRPTEKEIGVLREWIDSGAAGPDGAEPVFPELATPAIAPQAHVRSYVTSLALAPDGKVVAVGGYRRVDLAAAANGEIVATVEPLPGKVNSIAYARDGAVFVAASGVAGLYGTATICRAADGAIVSQIKGHRDAIYDAEFSADGRLLVTCSYDRQVMLWDVAAGELVKTLSGHHGAVFELAFSPDGSLLASASADGTVKIWHLATGQRLDTLGQPEGEQHAVAISPDGRWLAAGGADRQLRMWQLVSRDRPEINPLKFARAGHESPNVEIAFSPDGSKLLSAAEGGDVILWDAATLMPLHRYEQQPDVVTGVAFDSSGSGCYVARLDGSWQRYPVEAHQNGTVTSASGQEVVAAPAVPETNSAPLEVAEQEPNDSAAAANAISAMAKVSGVIAAPEASRGPDVDLYRIQGRAGQQFVLEIDAARQKSPLDSRLEVLDAAGSAIPRVVLQAVRKSYFTFRGLDSAQIGDFRLHGWQDMELNEFLFASGEVAKLWMYPRGPDSGFIVYPGVGGSRYTYFGTTALAHAQNEPCYVVEAHPPGTELVSNGLPQYTVYYENDDDGWRRFGADSRLTFTAPADGDYLVRVSDVRGWGGDDYRYALTIRAPRPDFQIKVTATDLTINAGSGKEFSVEADRMDEFDGDIHVDVSGLPPGFHVSSPLIIQSGQTTVYGTIAADADAPAPTAENSKLTKVTASALVNGKQIEKEPVDLGELKLAERPKLLVQVISTANSPDASAEVSGSGRDALELVIAPGETIAAVVKVERDGFNGEISFGEEHSGRNLPHGVYVDNIGLNGLTLLEGESERTFFITAAKWVPETSRPFHLRANVEGNQTSWPVSLHVRGRQSVAASE